MAKRKIHLEDEIGITKNWREGDLILNFGLERITSPYSQLMEEWLNVENPSLKEVEKFIIEDIFKKATQYINAWSEEDLKMKFISPVLQLGSILDEGNGIVSFFDKLISAEVEGVELSTKTDFMIATGVLDVFRKPYFHFQEYKPNKNPTGDSMAQLLTAFLIAQTINQDGKPLYGAEIIGKNWTFVVMQGKEYCLSQAYNCTRKDDLLKIIAILRKFKEILFTKLLKD